MEKEIKKSLSSREAVTRDLRIFVSAGTVNERKEIRRSRSPRRTGEFRDDRSLFNNGNNRAFTLIELLVVVLIIGILAAVALPQYQKAVDKARYIQARNLLENVWQAEQRYKLATGSYTMRFDDLDIEMPTSTDIHHDSDADYYNYQWGNCWLHNTGYIACKVKLGSSAAAWYFARSHSTARECWAAPGTSTRADALCKAVTQKSTGSDSSTYKIYKF